MVDEQTRLGQIVSDLAGLGKIGEALVSSVQKLIGGALAPTQIRRIGRAETDVEFDRTVRLAEAEAIVEALRSGDFDVKARAGQRLLSREIRRQENAEAILGRTVALIEPEAQEVKDKAQPPEDDWIEAFWRYAENASDAKLQRLWASILARKITNQANAVSLATLDSLRLIEAHQAEAFIEMVRAWAAFGSLPDISVGDPPDPCFTIYKMDNLALQGLGLAEIVHRPQNYLQGKGWAFLFHNRKPGFLTASRLHARTYQTNEFGHIRPSWRGLELSEVVLPGLSTIIPEDPSATQLLGRWADTELRAKVIHHWAETFAGWDCVVTLTRHAGSKPLDDANGRRAMTVQTHCFQRGEGWKRLEDVSDGDVEGYPPEIHQMLSVYGG